MARTDVTVDPIPREAMLARAFVELADTLVADFDVVELLTRLADRCRSSWAHVGRARWRPSRHCLLL